MGELAVTLPGREAQLHSISSAIFRSISDDPRTAARQSDLLLLFLVAEHQDLGEKVLRMLPLAEKLALRSSCKFAHNLLKPQINNLRITASSTWLSLATPLAEIYPAVREVAVDLESDPGAALRLLPYLAQAGRDILPRLLSLKLVTDPACLSRYPQLRPLLTQLLTSCTALTALTFACGPLDFDLQPPLQAAGATLQGLDALFPPPAFLPTPWHGDPGVVDPAGPLAILQSVLQSPPTASQLSRLSSPAETLPPNLSHLQRLRHLTLLPSRAPAPILTPVLESTSRCPHLTHLDLTLSANPPSRLHHCIHLLATFPSLRSLHCTLRRCHTSIDLTPLSTLAPLLSLSLTLHYATLATSATNTLGDPIYPLLFAPPDPPNPDPPPPPNYFIPPASWLNSLSRLTHLHLNAHGSFEPPLHLPSLSSHSALLELSAPRYSPVLHTLTSLTKLIIDGTVATLSYDPPPLSPFTTLFHLRHLELDPHTPVPAPAATFAPLPHLTLLHFAVARPPATSTPCAHLALPSLHHLRFYFTDKSRPSVAACLAGLDAPNLRSFTPYHHHAPPLHRLLTTQRPQFNTPFSSLYVLTPGVSWLLLLAPKCPHLDPGLCAGAMPAGPHGAPAVRPLTIPADWLASAAQVWPQLLQFADCSGDGEVVHATALAGGAALRALTIQEAVPDAALAAVARHCTALTELRLEGCAVDLHEEPFTARGVLSVARGCALLARLHVRMGPCGALDDAAVEAIAGGCLALQSVDLDGLQQVSERALCALGHAQPLLQYVLLDDAAALTVEGVRVMVGWHSSRLLGLEGRHAVGGAGLAALQLQSLRGMHDVQLQVFRGSRVGPLGGVHVSVTDRRVSICGSLRMSMPEPFEGLGC